MRRKPEAWKRTSRTITVGSTAAQTLQAANEIAQPGDAIIVPVDPYSGARLFTDGTTIIGSGVGQDESDRTIAQQMSRTTSVAAARGKEPGTVRCSPGWQSHHLCVERIRWCDGVE